MIQIILTIIGTIISAGSVIVLILQLNSIRRENRLSQTFTMIRLFDQMLYEKQENKDILEELFLSDDFTEKVLGEEGVTDLLKDQGKKNQVYYILNYFEELSSAIHEGYVDENLIYKMCGARFMHAYAKLKPVINKLDSYYTKTFDKPYQYFTYVAEHWDNKGCANKNRENKKLEGKNER